jgi:hypothetical protein
MIDFEEISPQLLSSLFEDININKNISFEELKKIGIEGLVKVLKTDEKEGLNTSNL